jgi:hypothetical protein
MLAYFRKNMVAFVALFVSFIAIGGTTAYAVNTVRSADIVDGQVKNADLGADSVASGKIIDNSVLGADVRESTLGRVPDASKLAGKAATSLRQRSRTSTVSTSDCGVQNTWVSCAPVAVVVPAGRTYRVTVSSTVNAGTAAATQEALFCPATSGPSCITGIAESVSFWAGGFTSSSATAAGVYPAGSYTFVTALHLLGPILTSNNGHTTTTVEYYDTASENVG